jgi:hypothetical protein
VEQAIEADRRYFAEHSDEDEYIREFVPGEFGKAELPPTCTVILDRDVRDAIVFALKRK